MLAASEERCGPRQGRWWATPAGRKTFARLVQRLAPEESAEPERLDVELEKAVLASDFLITSEVDARVHAAAETLANRMRSETLRIAKHRQFVTEPQPARPSVVYGEADAPHRDSLPSASLPSSPFFGKFLDEQRRLGVRFVR